MQIEQNIPLAPFTTLRIGGPARYFVQAEDEQDLWEAMHAAREQEIPLFPLGGGSNLLVPDEGFSGLVIHVAITPSIVRTDTPEGIYFDVSAGTDWDAFVLHVCEQGISGIECLAGIPGLAGGVPVQNIGAYGQEVSQTIENVRALDLESSWFTTLSSEDCQFAYRSSLFNTIQPRRYIISSVRFRFSANATPTLNYADLKKHFAPNPNPTPLEIYEAVRQIRRTKGMLILPNDTDPDFRSAGSFFKNPIVPAETLTRIAQTLAIDPAKIPHWPTKTGEVKLPAAWLIEQAGFPKGYVQGQAAISTRHTLALVNHSGHSPCADLTALRDTITHRIQTLFGIPLHQEPVFLS